MNYFFLQFLRQNCDWRSVPNYVLNVSIFLSKEVYSNFQNSKEILKYNSFKNLKVQKITCTPRINWGTSSPLRPKNPNRMFLLTADWVPLGPET